MSNIAEVKKGNSSIKLRIRIMFPYYLDHNIEIMGTAARAAL